MISFGNMSDLPIAYAFCFLLFFLCAMHVIVPGLLWIKTFKKLPLCKVFFFVSIRYHKFFRFSIHNIVRTHNFVFVQNTDLRFTQTFLVDSTRLDLI